MERKVETSSISKRKKSCGEVIKHVSTKESGIEKLPDEMLCHIQSYMGTKDVVRTSVLSKRWRYFWTSVPFIDIQYPKHGCYSIDFIHNFLRLNTVSCLRKFSLSWSEDYKQHSSELISVILKRDIEEIVLTKSSGDRFIYLPPSIFTCKKLVILKIGFNFNFLLDVHSLVYLPSLKILHICLGNLLFGKDSMKIILDGCPVIEELNIRGVEEYIENTLSVQSSSIKKLRLCSGYSGHSTDLKIVVDVPNVERLDLMNRGNVQYDINSLSSSLVKLMIDIKQGSGLVQLLMKFTNTKHMVISNETIRSLERQRLGDFPMFHNLTHLVVDFHECNLTVLPVLLECSPNIVTLELYSVGTGRYLWEQRLHHFKVPKCVMLYLEVIEIKGLKGLMHEMEMISYFLKNSMVLKKLSIQSVSSSAKKHSEISTKLFTFPKSSPDCQIIFD